MNIRTCYSTALACLVVLSGRAADAAMHEFYVTVDGRDALTFGSYSGLSNPNLGRLTLLYAHWNDETPASNHFHGIGTYAYTGPVDDPVVVPANANNRIPETYTGQAPLTLTPGTGALSGKLISGFNEEEYSDLTLYSIHDLAGSPEMSPEWYMYQSSGGGYASTTLDGSQLALEIVSMTPGLRLGTEGLSEPGARLEIGGADSLPFEPIFWTEADAAPGTYSAELMLVDLAGTYLPSGTFAFDFAVVPEPTSATLVALLAIPLGLVRRR